MRAPLLVLLTPLLLLAPPAGSARAAPELDAATLAACTRALDVLTDELLGEAEPATGPGGILNAAGDGRRLMAQAFTLLALRAHPEADRWSTARRALEAEMAAFARSGLAVQDAWPLALIGLDLAERARRGVPDAELAAEVAYRIESSQNAEGGWSHGQALSAVDFYPSTLMAATNGCTSALALLATVGVDVDERVLERALALYRDVQGEPGAFPYGGRAYRKGYEAGRSAGAVFALATLGVEGALLERASAYVARHVGAIPRGHASAAYHVFYGALGCAVIGGDVAAAFDQEVLHPLVARQLPSGHFPGAHPSPDELALMGTEVDRRGYITAATTAALVAPRLRILEGLRRDPAATGSPPPSPPEDAPAMRAIWQRPVRSSALLRHGPHLLVADAARAGRLLALDPDDGEQRWSVDHPVAREEGAQVVALAPSGPLHVVVLHRRIEGGVMPVRVAGLDVSTPTIRTWISRHAIDGGELRWTREIPGDVLDLDADDSRVCVLLRGGRCSVLDAGTGAPRHDGEVEQAVVNGAVVALPTGHAAAGEARLRVWDTDGALRWRRRGRTRRGLVPPAYGPLAWAGGHVLATRTDGRIEALDALDGRRVWALETPSAPWSATVLGDDLVVLGYDATLRAVDVREGALHWSLLLPRGTEAMGEPRLAAGGGRVACALPGGEHVWVVDAVGGVTGTVGVGSVPVLAVDDERVYVGDGRGLGAWGAEDR